MHDHLISGDTINDANPLPGVAPSVAGSTGDVAAPAANTAAVVTYSATPGKAHCIGGLLASYSAAPTGGNLQVADGGSVILNVDVPAVGPFFFPFPRPMKGTAGNAMTITLAAGSGSVAGKLSVINHWTE